VKSIGFRSENPASDWLVPYTALVGKAVARCDKRELGFEDEDWLGSQAELVGKLLPINVLKWFVPVPGSYFDVVESTVCWSAVR
jgi:hypothetical protein